jgi:hypothetical protein
VGVKQLYRKRNRSGSLDSRTGQDTVAQKCLNWQALAHQLGVSVGLDALAVPVRLPRF